MQVSLGKQRKITCSIVVLACGNTVQEALKSEKLKNKESGSGFEADTKRIKIQNKDKVVQLMT